jgi:hypothetical protein
LECRAPSTKGLGGTPIFHFLKNPGAAEVAKALFRREVIRQQLRGIEKSASK